MPLQDAQDLLADSGYDTPPPEDSDYESDGSDDSAEGVDADGYDEDDSGEDEETSHPSSSQESSSSQSILPKRARATRKMPPPRSVKSVKTASSDTTKKSKTHTKRSASVSAPPTEKKAKKEPTNAAAAAASHPTKKKKTRTITSVGDAKKRGDEEPIFAMVDNSDNQTIQDVGARGLNFSKDRFRLDTKTHVFMTSNSVSQGGRKRFYETLVFEKAGGKEGKEPFRFSLNEKLVLPTLRALCGITGMELKSG